VYTLLRGAYRVAPLRADGPPPAADGGSVGGGLGAGQDQGAHGVAPLDALPASLEAASALHLAAAPALLLGLGRQRCGAQQRQRRGGGRVGVPVEGGDGADGGDGGGARQARALGAGVGAEAAAQREAEAELDVVGVAGAGVGGVRRRARPLAGAEDAQEVPGRHRPPHTLTNSLQLLSSKEEAWGKN